MTIALVPVIAPPKGLEPGPTRDLLTALHEHGWMAHLPATAGWAIVSSPDGARSMKVAIDPLASDLDRIEAFIDNRWLPTAWAATYVREG